MKCLWRPYLPSVLQSLVDRHARLTVMTAIAITAASLVLLPGLHFENRPGQLDLPLDDPERVRLEDFKSRFGDSELLIIGIELHESIGKDVARAIQSVCDSLGTIDEIRAVHSLTNTPLLKWVPSLAVHRLRPTYPIKKVASLRDSLPAKIIEDIRQRAAFNGNFISANGEYPAIIVTLNPQTIDGYPVKALLKKPVNRIKTLCEQNLGQYADLHYAGPVILDIALNNAMHRDLTLFGPISLVAFLVILILLFGSWRPVVLAFGTAFMALSWSLALLPLTSTPMSINLSMMIPIIPALSLMYAIHHLCCLYRPDRSTDEPVESLHCFQKLVMPGILCGLTTCIGFLTLSVSNLSGIREAGIFIGCGVLFSAFIANFVLPAFVNMVGWRGVIRVKYAGLNAVVGSINYLRTIVLKYAGSFAIITITVMAIVTYGIVNLDVETNHLSFLEADRDVTAAFSFMDRHFGGVLPMEVLVDLSENPTAEEIGVILNLEKELRNISGVGTVISAADFIRDADRDRPKGARLLKPQLRLDRGYISPDIWEILEHQFSGTSLVDRCDSVMTLRIICRLRTASSRELRKVISEVKAAIARQLPNNNFIITGLSSYFVRVERHVISTQIESFGLAIVATIIMLGILSGSIRNAFIVIFVNILPVTLVLGMMGWSGIALDVSTVMIAPIALGIVVDDTIHLLFGYNRMRYLNNSVSSSMSHAFREIGRPVISTTIILSVGFGSLMAARFVPTFQFGALATFTVIAAALADFLLLPALITVLHKREEN